MKRKHIIKGGDLTVPEPEPRDENISWTEDQGLQAVNEVRRARGLLPLAKDHFAKHDVMGPATTPSGFPAPTPMRGVAPSGGAALAALAPMMAARREPGRAKDTNVARSDELEGAAALDRDRTQRALRAWEAFADARAWEPEDGREAERWRASLNAPLVGRALAAMAAPLVLALSRASTGPQSDSIHAFLRVLPEGPELSIDARAGSRLAREHQLEAGGEVRYSPAALTNDIARSLAVDRRWAELAWAATLSLAYDEPVGTELVPRLLVRRVSGNEDRFEVRLAADD